MPEPTLRILLIENDPAFVAQVRTMLSQAQGISFDLQSVEALLPGLDRLAKSDFDVVLIDASLPDTHGLDSVEALCMHAPGVPLIILSGQDNEAMALRAVHIGAQDYLVKGKLESQLLCRSLRCATIRHKIRAEAPALETAGSPGRLIGCIGAKGGVGTTTIACHTALELKRQTGQRVLLADLDMSGASIGFLTQSKSTYTILDAADDLLRLDRSFWEKVVGDGPEEVEVLPLLAPICSHDPEHADRIRYVLRFLRTIYPWLVVDLGRLSPFTASLLSNVTDLLLMTTFDLAAARDCGQVVMRLAELGFESRHVTLVVNEVPKIDCVAAREVSKTLGIPNSIIVPEGSTGLFDSKNSVRAHIARLAARLAGIQEPAASWKRWPFLSAISTRSRQLKTA
ncbi:MAG: response regulator [Bryobacteraceae bacterium]|jgi:pilus assembly protein CpaE